MPRQQEDNIHYAIGWFCGAVFPAAPIVALVYLLRHRPRLAFQAMMTCVVALPFIIGARALMLSAGLQRKPAQWVPLNVLILIAFPLLATRFARALHSPRTGAIRPCRRGHS